MLPGLGGGLDPRKMNQMMKQLGIDVKEIPGVSRVVFETEAKDYVFENPEITLMLAQGQKTYQIVGDPKVVEKGGAGKAPAAEPQEPAPTTEDVKLEFSDDDVKMVMEQTGASKKDAMAALEATGGDLAEAIVKLSDD